MSEELKRLLELAKKPLRKPLKKLEYGSNVFQFISECNIRSSTHDKIDYAIIYFKYSKWCNAHGFTPLQHVKFSQDFKKKFEKTTNGSGRIAYYISPEGFDLTPHNEQEARLYLQEVTTRAKAKKEAKKSSKKRLKQGPSTPHKESEGES